MSTTSKPEQDKIRALALLAGIEPKEIHELPNGYDSERKDPWCLFICEDGTFTIGWRKRVLAVSWTHGDAESITEESEQWITHGPRFFHAWGWPQALRYLEGVVKGLNAQVPASAGGEAS